MRYLGSSPDPGLDGCYPRRVWITMDFLQRGIHHWSPQIHMEKGSPSTWYQSDTRVSTLSKLAPCSNTSCLNPTAQTVPCVGSETSRAQEMRSQALVRTIWKDFKLSILFFHLSNWSFQIRKTKLPTFWRGKSPCTMSPSGLVSTFFSFPLQVTSWIL